MGLSKKKKNLLILFITFLISFFFLEVISQTGDKKGNNICYSGQGFLVNSGNFNGMETSRAFNEICDYLSNHGLGEARTQGQ